MQMPLLIEAVEANPAIAFSLPDIAKVLFAAFMSGTLWATVIMNKRRISKLEDLVERRSGERERERQETLALIDNALNRFETSANTRIARVEESNRTLELRFLSAIENLGANMNALALRLEAVVAVHTEQITTLRKNQDKE